MVETCESNQKLQTSSYRSLSSRDGVCGMVTIVNSTVQCIRKCLRVLNQENITGQKS